jgi:hypothetical protein
MARTLKRSIRQYVQDQLVDPILDESFDSAAQGPEITAIQWQPRNHAGKFKRLYTAYGKLEVCRALGGHTVMRDGDWLVQAGGSRAAIFATERAARAAGLVHLKDGWADDAPLGDGLGWKTERLPPEQQLPQSGSLADHTLADDHEWGRRRLKELLKTSGAEGCAADDNLMLDMEACARAWQLTPPSWTKRARGFLELDTPYGILVVHRLIGWTVERDGVPLVWFLSGEKVIFDKIEHAKTSALVHARDHGSAGLGHGVSWGRTAGNQLGA